jgi:ribosomal protein L20
MARVKRSKIAMKHRRNVLKRAKGYQFGRSKKEVEATIADGRIACPNCKKTASWKDE